jgi:hypothetical protein
VGGRSVLLLDTGWVAPTALAYAFVIAHATIVAIFGELQILRPATIERDRRMIRANADGDETDHWSVSSLRIARSTRHRAPFVSEMLGAAQ